MTHMTTRMAVVLAGAVLGCLSAAHAQPGNSGERSQAPSKDAPQTSQGQSAPAEKLSPLELAQWIDGQFEERFKLKLAASEVVDDATFLRRAYLDLVGAIPSVAETRDFLADKNTYKREDLIDRLLADRRSAEHMARVWRRVLVPGSAPNAMYATQMEPWLVQQFSTNVPYDDFARSLITATGAQGGSPMVFYQAIGNRPENLANAFSRIFLGVRLGCAQCHDHPFADWKQEDFWGLAAFFAGMNANQPNGTATDTRLAKIKPEDSDREYVARFLWDGEAEIPEDKLPRQVLAEWLASPKNPNFAATAVNRVWQHLCGRGMAGSVDDLDQVDPAERALLDALAGKFAEADFDLRWLIQGISKTKVYQRRSGSATAAGEPPAPAHRSLKTLSPEQVFDSLEQALALPVSRSDASPRYNGERDQLVLRLNEAYDESPEQFRAGIPQTLIMMNGRLISKATDLDESRTLRAVIEAPFLSASEKIETLYLAAFTRKPRPDELETMLQLVKSQPDTKEQRRVYAEIFWAILNSPEFVLSR
jgi:hypothetical protein